MSLNQERAATFNKDALAQLLHSKLVPDISVERLRELREKVSKIPEMINSFEKYHHNREQSIIRGLKHGQAWKRFMDKEKLNKAERRVVLGFFTELTPHTLHYEFFLPSLELQCSQEQKEKWLPLCESLEIVGCYAQTELGHGSNVRGIEIEAIYDDLTKEFVMNSPTITATKWWIGGLGVAATDALVIARLKIKGQDYGPHPFFIPIRDRKTHLPFRGVDVGDIGPKMGNHCADNGYLRFDHYRVSKESLLNRFARINDNGDYEIIDTNAIKILYLSLIRARSTLIFDGWYPLALSLLISVRYSLIREQFPDPENPKKEKKILDYQIQQYKLFRVLARFYAIIFIRPYIKSLYNESEKSLNSGEETDLSYLHCIISLYKSFVTYGVLEGIEEARRSCGGHGFMMLSGLPSIYLEYLPSITYDGDNSILALQATRYIMSILRKTKAVPEQLKYLIEPAEKIQGDPGSAHFHQNCFETAARNRFQRLLKRERLLLTQGKTKDNIWNHDLQVEAIDACEAVYHASVHKYFSQGISEITDAKVKEAVEILRQIYATSELEKFQGEIVRAGATLATFDSLKQIQLEGFEKTRSNALALVEAFEISDLAINSVIANKDGNIYEGMLRTSKYLNPLNKNRVFPGIKNYLRPKI